MLNSGEEGFVNFENFRPGLGLRAGIVNTIGSFTKLASTGTRTGGINLALNIDNVQLYDTRINEERVANPISSVL